MLNLLCLSFGQKEQNIWYFGNLAGINFNTTAATPLINSAMSTMEGCSSMSDNNGNLLFYTDGVNVWNRLHSIMPNGNGLHGSSTSTQSGVIVKKPGANNLYLIFTVAPEGSSGGLKYTEVNMSLSNGYGAVTSNKNILISTPVCEKLIITPHSNGTDFWVLTYSFGLNEIQCYLLDSSGLNLSPIISTSGVTPIWGTDAIGQMKCSKDGSRIAIAHQTNNKVELLNFDNSSGLASGLITIPFPNLPNGYFEQTMGVEFSPNGNLLYVATAYNLYQFDLLAGSITDIVNSRFTIGQNILAGQIQLAPNGKIYHAQLSQSSIGVINNPEIYGSGCNYINNGFYLAGRTSSYGLPFSISQINNPQITANNLCFGDTAVFFLSSSQPIDSLFWDFGNIASGTDNYSTDSIASHVFTNSGSYLVSLTTYTSGFASTYNLIVNIYFPPNVNLGPDRKKCIGEFTSLNLAVPNATYLWSDNSNGSSLIINEGGIYSVNVTVNGCTVSDTILIEYGDPPTVNLGNDTSICLGDSLLLNAYYPNANYLWTNGSTDYEQIIYEDGIYSVEVSNEYCSIEESIQIFTVAPPNPNLGPDMFLCKIENINLEILNNPNSTYLWNDNSIATVLPILEPGEYWVLESNICGVEIDTIKVSQLDCNEYILMPNTFTPNNDGINDFFLPIQINNLNFQKLIILNRWGQSIFSSNSITSGWDGTYLGNPCAAGVYFWKVVLTDNENNTFEKSGFLHLHD